MECWNFGFGGIKSAFKGLAEIKKIKSDPYLLLIPNIPFFHYSTIPFDVKRKTLPLQREAKA